MVWSCQENLHFLAALEAPSHSLELMGWEPPEGGGILWFWIWIGRKVCGGATHPDPEKKESHLSPCHLFYLWDKSRPWKCPEGLWMWHSGTWINGGLGTAGGWSWRVFPTLMISWFHNLGDPRNHPNAILFPLVGIRSSVTGESLVTCVVPPRFPWIFSSQIMDLRLNQPHNPAHSPVLSSCSGIPLIRFCGLDSSQPGPSNTSRALGKGRKIRQKRQK